MKINDQNQVPEITVSDLVKQLVEIYVSAIDNRDLLRAIPAPFLWGPPGVGKSDCVAQLAEQLEKKTGKAVHVTDIRLLLFSPIDLRGIPVADADRQFTNWLKPKIFDMDDSRDVINILFLDELSAAPPAVQAAAYQITLNHTVAEHRLPDNCIVIAAGNRTSDRSVACRMPNALANRLMHFEIKVSFEAWRTWSMAHDVHPWVLGYLTFDPDKLLLSEVGIDQTAFPTPRSWMFVSSLLHAMGKEVDYSTLYSLVSGCVGTGTAAGFVRWCKSGKYLPDAESIFGNTELQLPKKPDELYTVLMIMINYAKKREGSGLGKGIPMEELVNGVDYVSRFPADYQTCFYREMCQTESMKKKLLRIPEFLEWMRERSTTELEMILGDL